MFGWYLCSSFYLHRAPGEGYFLQSGAPRSVLSHPSPEKSEGWGTRHSKLWIAVFYAACTRCTARRKPIALRMADKLRSSGFPSADNVR